MADEGSGSQDWRRSQLADPTGDLLILSKLASLKAKLIFNPTSGNPAESAVQLLEVLRHYLSAQMGCIGTA